MNLLLLKKSSILYRRMILAGRERSRLNAAYWECMHTQTATAARIYIVVIHCARILCEIELLLLLMCIANAIFIHSVHIAVASLAFSLTREERIFPVESRDA